MKFKKGLIVAAALAGSAGVYAQSTTADFLVGGSIINASCYLAITGGAVDLGALTSTGVKALPLGSGVAATMHKISTVGRTLTVTCDAPQTVAVAFQDPNEAGKLIADTAWHNLVNSAQANAPVGAFRMYHGGTQTVDSQPVVTVLESVGLTGTPATWTAAASNALMRTGNSYSWLGVAGTAPAALTTASLGYFIESYVDEPSMNTQLAAGAVTLAGRLTATVRTL